VTEKDEAPRKVESLGNARTDLKPVRYSDTRCWLLRVRPETWVLVVAALMALAYAALLLTHGRVR
jgi:hypothetical protein